MPEMLSATHTRTCSHTAPASHTHCFLPLARLMEKVKLLFSGQRHTPHFSCSTQTWPNSQLPMLQSMCISILPGLTLLASGNFKNNQIPSSFSNAPPHSPIWHALKLFQFLFNLSFYFFPWIIIFWTSPPTRY